MNHVEEDDPDLRAGFIFLGNHPALDFLNTELTQRDEPFEFLTDVRAFSRWLAAAGFLSAASARQAAIRWSRRSDCDAFMIALRGFRAELRGAVRALETGRRLAPAFLARLNVLLAEYPTRYELRADDAQPTRFARYDLREPDGAYGPLAAAVLDLLTGDPARVRKCEACPGQFLDTSKKGARRWCSMRRCGNRVKVAAYAQRRSDRRTR